MSKKTKKLPFGKEDILHILGYAERDQEDSADINRYNDELKEEEQNLLNIKTIVRMMDILPLFVDMANMILNEDHYTKNNLHESDTRWKALNKDKKRIIKKLKESLI